MTIKTQLLSFFEQGVVEAGCDEAGRGCLAGPVVARPDRVSGGHPRPGPGDTP